MALEKRPHITRRSEGLNPRELEDNQEYYDRMIRDLQNQIEAISEQLNNHESRITALE